MIAKYEPRLARPRSDFRPARDLAAGTDSAAGNLPAARYLARTFFVLSFDSWTLGWSKGSMPRTEPATAAALPRRPRRRASRPRRRLGAASRRLNAPARAGAPGRPRRPPA